MPPSPCALQFGLTGVSPFPFAGGVNLWFDCWGDRIAIMTRK